MLKAKKTLTVCLLVLVCLSSACTTLRPVGMEGAGDSVRQEIKPGDTVRAVMKGGAVHSLQVTDVGATSLSGTAVRAWGGGSDPVGSRIDVPYSEVAELDVKRPSGLKTTGLVLGVAAVIALIASGGGSHDVGYGNR